MVRIVASKARDLLRDETGGEVMEYALILGLISVVCISLIAAYGTKVLAKWTSVNDQFTE